MTLNFVDTIMPSRNDPEFDQWRMSGSSSLLDSAKYSVETNFNKMDWFMYCRVEALKMGMFGSVVKMSLVNPIIALDVQA